MKADCQGIVREPRGREGNMGEEQSEQGRVKKEKREREGGRERKG